MMQNFRLMDSAADLAEKLGVPPRDVRDAIERMRLRPAGGEMGRDYYDPDIVLPKLREALAATRAR